MERIWQAPGRDVWLGEAGHPPGFSTPFPGRTFALLLLITEETTAEQRDAICEAIVRSGCRYAVCWGIDCEGWHDTIDESYLATCPDFQPQDDTMIMTSWHARELVGDAVFFLLHGTNFETLRFDTYFILQIGRDPGVMREARRSVAYLLAS
jgi:hypothetical protein